MINMKRPAIARAMLAFATAFASSAGAAVAIAPDMQAAQAEIQIGLCAPGDRIVQALDLRPRGAPIEVWQFDDDALSLFGRGLRFRLRVEESGRAELTLKVANQDCARLDPALVPQGDGKCEYDVYGSSVTGTVSLTRRLAARSTRDLLGGRAALSDVLGPVQIGYLRDAVGLWPLPSGIRGLGPMRVQTYRTKVGRYDVDVSQLPGGEDFAEISRKVVLSDASAAMKDMEAYLSRSGIALCADQSSQARSKLRALLH
jgi:hypothetical protein